MVLETTDQVKALMQLSIHVVIYLDGFYLTLDPTAKTAIVPTSAVVLEPLDPDLFVLIGQVAFSGFGSFQDAYELDLMRTQSRGVAILNPTLLVYKFFRQLTCMLCPACHLYFS